MPFENDRKVAKRVRNLAMVRAQAHLEERQRFSKFGFRFFVTTLIGVYGSQETNAAGHRRRFLSEHSPTAGDRLADKGFSFLVVPASEIQLAHEVLCV